MSDLSSLIARLEKAEGPDREIGGDVHNSLVGTSYVYAPHSVTGFLTSTTDNGCPTVPAYTSSIDAAVSLAIRVLPGWVFDLMEQDYETDPIGYRAFAWTVELINGVRVQGQASTLPVAICLATLRALDQKGSSNG